MGRYAARVGATLPDGVPGVGELVGHALEQELVGEPHGPIEVHAFPPELAYRAMAAMGVTADSPARVFLDQHPDGVLVAALAKVDQ